MPTVPPGGVYPVGYRAVETVLLQGTTEALLLLTAIVGKALWRIEIRNLRSDRQTFADGIVVECSSLSVFHGLDISTPTFDVQLEFR